MGITAACFTLFACGKGDVTTPDGGSNDIKITFDAGDGVFSNGKTSVTVTADGNGTVDFDEQSVKDGHAFIGWYNGSVRFDGSGTYTKDGTFTAKYVSGNTDEVYTALFGENSTVSIDINMSDGEWKKLNRDYVVFNEKGSKSPIYRLADSVTVGIDGGDGMLYYYYEEVGVRMKGNTSRHEFYNDDGFYDNIHMKLSFKQTFDDPEDGYTSDELKVWADDRSRQARKDRRLAGMDKVDIKFNSTADESYVRELYAMKMFRDNGVAAPNVTLCSVTALEKNENKRNLGVYRLHEPIDEAFIARNFGEEDPGDLWKCTYTKTGPADLTNYDLDSRMGVEDEMKGEFYTYDKKTNKKKDKITGLRDFTSMRNFIAAVGSGDADYPSILDTDGFAKFEAVNYLLGNPDCIRNNYNNYYIYFRKSDGKAVIIPYDYDRCLGITKDWDPTGNACMTLQPYTRQIAANGGSQNDPIYRALICKGAPTNSGSVLMKFRDDLISLAAETDRFTEASFNAYKDNYKQRYSSFTADALSTNNTAFDSHDTGNVSVGRYMSAKRETLAENIDNYYD